MYNFTIQHNTPIAIHSFIKKLFGRLAPAALAAALAALRESPCQAHRAWCLTDRFKMCEDHQHGV
jgi:hypothetical protein